MSTDGRTLDERLWGWWEQIQHEQSSPRRLGLAVALGVLLGTSPLFGAQTILALLLAYALRLNKLAVLLGLQISVPPITPLVYLVTLQVGALLVQGHLAPMSLSALRQVPPQELLARFALFLSIGGGVVGLTAGGALGALTAALVKRRREGSAPLRLDATALDGLGQRLARLPRALRSYGIWKVRLDPVYPLALARLEGAREVVDLGGGIGLLAALLAARYPAVKVKAVEWDPRKAAAARKVTADLPGVEVVEGDARQAFLGAPDAVLLLDVLHYSPIEEQRQWLQRCALALAPGGVLIIRELDPRYSRRAERLDRLAVRFGWNRGEAVHAWPLDQMQEQLEAVGLEVSRNPAGRGLFRANALLVATKNL